MSIVINKIYNVIPSILLILIYSLLGTFITKFFSSIKKYDNSLYKVGIISMIAIILHNIENSEEFMKLKEICELLDTNKDGNINFDEMKLVFKQIFPEYIVNDEKMNRIIETMDENKDGFISYEKFLRNIVNEIIILEKKNLKFAFDSFDINKDGKLSKSELLNVFGIGTSNYINKLFNLIDKNKDGFISFDEFYNLMKRINDM